MNVIDNQLKNQFVPSVKGTKRKYKKYMNKSANMINKNNINKYCKKNGISKKIGDNNYVDMDIYNENLDKIIKLQSFFHRKLRIISKIKKELILLSNIITSITQNLNDSLNLQIINSEIYSYYLKLLNKLTDILQINIKLPINLCNYVNTHEYTFFICIAKIKLELIHVIHNCGISNINDVLQLIVNKTIHNIDILDTIDMNNTVNKPIQKQYQKCTNSYIDKLYFYNECFIPTSVEIYSSIKDYDLISSFTTNNKIFTEPVCNSINDISMSLHEKIFGGKLYLPIDDKLLVIKGYFKKIFNTFPIICNTFLYEKYVNLQNKCRTYSSIPIIFKTNYIKYMQLQTFILNDENWILDKMNSHYKLYNKYKQYTLTNIIKEFLNSKPEIQIRLLTLFLLDDTKKDLQYIAYIMYDIYTKQIDNSSYIKSNDTSISISNSFNLQNFNDKKDSYSESTLVNFNNMPRNIIKNTKTVPIHYNIYYFLHWEIQNKLRNAVCDMDSSKKSLYDFTEDDIPYERRIQLMNADNSIKLKALDKLKEINSSKGESNAKAQQYLDGILKIPFGIYKKEPIIQNLEIYIDKVKSKFIILKELLPYNGYDKGSNKRSINIWGDLLNVINILLSSKKLTSSELEISIENLKNILKNISHEYNFDNFKNKPNNTKLLTKKKLMKCKKSQLLEILYMIDEKHNSHLNYTSRQNKGDLCNVILGYNRSNKCENGFISVFDIYSIIIHNVNDNVNVNVNDNVNVNVNDNVNNNVNVNETNCQFTNKLIKNNAHTHNTHTNNTHTHNIQDRKIFYNISVIIEELKKDLNDYKYQCTKYLEHVNKSLDKSVYGMIEPKLQIKRIIAQWINGDDSGYVFGLEGPAGTGKTTLARMGIANAIQDSEGVSRPFSLIPLGGSSNGSTLEGHNYTYVGSTWGKIVDTLITTKCMNPIIYIDELDKVSKTEHGKEIIGILIHMTDLSQNEEFADKYFSGVNIDISKCLIIFSYNDPNLIDKILLDRIHRIKINAMNKYDKVNVLKDHILPQIITSIGFKNEHIILEENEMIYIIETYTCEAGVRKLKEKVFELLREINLRYLMGSITNFPFKITIPFIKEIFSNKLKVHYYKIAKYPEIGIVNGLFATGGGLGGVLFVECYKTISDSRLSLKLTGMQGNTMKESMDVAKTVAWNLLTEEQKTRINKEESFGLHIHCPEGATPKDGPSAGAAITLTIYSRLVGKKIDNTIALTGEIRLNGAILKIGGLDLKVNGARRAGVKTVLCPKENKEELKKILTSPNYVNDPEFNIYMVDNIQEVIEYMIVNDE